MTSRPHMDAVEHSTSIESHRSQRTLPKSHFLKVLRVAEKGRTVRPSRRSLRARFPIKKLLIPPCLSWRLVAIAMHTNMFPMMVQMVSE
ncbi:hypothetical protein BpHYR1_046598 [Brachionus plicatilis]|uniref:Uncharacterized protein n=1 Tax=Brachionus plicatilis TaxID=10195 RepID=A0A3M7S3I0_BRAPC|nr:hypothetical protein BpHYR1_046598 [Brachionus plicatilis]